MALSPATFVRLYFLEMSQKTLAYELRVTQPRISQWERRPGTIPEKYREKVKALALSKKKRRIPDSHFTKVPIEHE